MHQLTDVDSLAGRVAIVTGAASGIGLATVRQLLAGGVRVAGLDRDASGLDRASGILDPTAFTTIVTDVGDEDSVERAVARCAEMFGEAATVLVQCAGIYRFAALLETSYDLWNDILGTNLGGTFLVARTFVRAAQAAGREAVIVNVASVAAFRGEAVEPKAAYAASKAGVIALTKQMAVEWSPLGIRVNVVVPGPTATPMLRILDDPDAGGAFLASLPVPRAGTADEIANVICFLASEKSCFMTGSVVVVDGGLLAAHASVPRPPSSPLSRSARPQPAS